jgi:8-oxo-dGTP pyrophosphatase MutT (NUDIX family)
MLSLNFIVRAVIVVDGKFLLTSISDGVRDPFFTFLGGHVALGETVMQAVRREVEEEIGLQVTPSKLLYISENFFTRGRGRLHELGYYFLCHPTEEFAGGVLDRISPNLGDDINPNLVAPDELRDVNFQPRRIGLLAAEDFANRFSGCPKLVVVNELPGEVAADDGVFEL